MGYVPRKVGLHGYLLEFCRGPIRESIELPLSHLCSDTLILTDLCLLSRLHGLPRSRKVQVFDASIRRAVHHVTNGVLRVRGLYVFSLPPEI